MGERCVEWSLCEREGWSVEESASVSQPQRETLALVWGPSLAIRVRRGEASLGMYFLEGVGGSRRQTPPRSAGVTHFPRLIFRTP